ncbi:MAG: UvrB/UvrC motif-containing protein [Oscillospiraceae bacterium]|jgi:protein arginine kinase activator
MKCQHCGNNEAEYQYTITVGNHQIERYLCSVCAKQLGYETEDASLSFDQLFSDFLNAQPQKQEPEISCPRCGSTWTEVQGSGKVGCAECYEIFSDRLLPYVQKLHGTAVHVGRTPQAASVAKKAEDILSHLQTQLEAAVEEQNYEQAAIYRDEIRALKGGMEQ